MPGRTVPLRIPASVSGVITNSSTELFAVNGYGTAGDVLDALADLWEEYLIDFPDDPDLKWLDSMDGADAFAANDEYLARVREWSELEYREALRAGVVILELPINTPDGFVEKVRRHFGAPSERVG